MNDDIDNMDVSTLLTEQTRLYEILNKGDVMNDNPLIPRLKMVKEEIDSRRIVGNLCTDKNILTRLLRVIHG